MVATIIALHLQVQCTPFKSCQHESRKATAPPAGANCLFIAFYHFLLRFFQNIGENPSKLYLQDLDVKLSRKTGFNSDVSKQCQDAVLKSFIRYWDSI